MELTNSVTRIWANTIGGRTRQVYSTGFQTFCRFLVLYGIVLIGTSLPPVSEDILIFFVAHCADTLKLQFSTIKMYLCGIRYHYLANGATNPLETPEGNNLPRLSLFLNGVKKSQKQNNRQRLPITCEILHKICGILTSGLYTTFEQNMYSAVCCVAFYGFLRCGEFTISHINSFDPEIHLCLNDVHIQSDDLVKICLKTSKTDHARRGVTILLFANGLPVCPHKNLCRYLKIRQCMFGNVPSSPLFVTQDGSPLTRAVFVQKLKLILQRIGLNTELYGGHSFRIGAATAAAKAKVEDHLIKTLGRWSSDCYQRNIRTSSETIKEAQINMSLF